MLQREEKDRDGRFVCWHDDDPDKCHHESKWLELFHFSGVAVQDTRDGEVSNKRCVLPTMMLLSVQSHLVTIKHETILQIWPWLTVAKVKVAMNDPVEYNRLCGRIVGTKIVSRPHIFWQTISKYVITVFLPKEDSNSNSDSDKE